MNLVELNNYFESYARRDKDLQHDPASDSTTSFFCLHTEDDADSIVRNCPLDLIMLLFYPDRHLIAGAGENYNWDKACCLLFLQRVPDRTDEAKKLEAVSFCEAMAEDYVKQMITDRSRALTGLDIGSFDIQPIGPVVDSHYGAICTFTVIDNFEQWVAPSRFT